MPKKDVSFQSPLSKGGCTLQFMHQIALKRCAYISVAAMMVLCIGAVWYYKERMIFTDASLVSFRRINLQDLESSQRRWGAFITECVPLLLAKLHVPLSAVLIAYSLSFNLFYLAVVCLLALRWQQYALSVLMSCYYLLFVSAGYFWTNNEIHQAVAYIFLCLGWTAHLRKKDASAFMQYAVFGILSGIALFTHPLAIIVFVFLWVALWLSRQDWPYSSRQALHYTIILVLWSVLKLLLSNGQAYDARRMNGITHMNTDLLRHAFSGPVARSWYKACINNYWLSLIAAAIAVIIVLSERKWLLAAWIAVCGAGFLILLHCGFPDGHFLYYLEGEWAIMGIIAGFPIVYYLLPKLNATRAAIALAVIFAVRIGYMLQAAPAFSKRIRFIESLNTFARNHHLDKVLIKASDSRFESQLFMDWGLATESMTLSALAGDVPQITLCALWPDHPERIPNGNQEMVWNFDKRPASALNQFYFTLDTTHPYVVVSYEDMARELR
jgi:hypothetical protein